MVGCARLSYGTPRYLGIPQMVPVSGSEDRLKLAQRSMDLHKGPPLSPVEIYDVAFHH